MSTDKLSELSKPEQFDAEVEIHGGEPFAVWAPAVNGSHVKKEQYFALLAELEAKDERIAELEAKLATPVRLLGEMLPHEWERAERQAAFEHRKIAWDARLAEDKKAILAAGFTFTFTVEGDE